MDPQTLPTSTDQDQEQITSDKNESDLLDIQKLIQQETEKISANTDVLQVTKENDEIHQTPDTIPKIPDKEKEHVLTPAMFMINKPIIGGIKPKPQKSNFKTDFNIKSKKVLIPLAIGLALVVISGIIYYFLINQKTAPAPEQIPVPDPLPPAIVKLTITGLLQLSAKPEDDKYIQKIVDTEEQFSDIPTLKLDYLKQNIDINNIDIELQSIKISE